MEGSFSSGYTYRAGPASTVPVLHQDRVEQDYYKPPLLSQHSTRTVLYGHCHNLPADPTDPISAVEPVAWLLNPMHPPGPPDFSKGVFGNEAAMRRLILTGVINWEATPVWYEPTVAMDINTWDCRPPGVCIAIVLDRSPHPAYYSLDPREVFNLDDHAGINWTPRANRWYPNPGRVGLADVNHLTSDRFEVLAFKAFQPDTFVNWHTSTAFDTGEPPLPVFSVLWQMKNAQYEFRFDIDMKGLLAARRATATPPYDQYPLMNQVHLCIWEHGGSYRLTGTASWRQTVLQDWYFTMYHVVEGQAE